jgi:hypothetical protein
VQGDNLIIFAILFMCLAPILFFAGIGGAVAAIAAAPNFLRARGLAAPDWVLRGGAALFLAGLLLIVWPAMGRFVIQLATLFLPVAIAVFLLVALACAAARRREGFGPVFWRIAAPVPVLCGVFVLLMIPTTFWKLQSIEQHWATVEARPAAVR